jgi:DNA-binding LacI/PurR family transcriptional regulator
VKSSAVTIGDVAALAGVSKSTVSKHLTGRPYVSPATAARIEAAIRELDFHPNPLARGLASGTESGLIGVVVASIANPFYTDLIQAIDLEARRVRYNLILGQADRDPPRERDVVQALQEHGVGGMILASAYLTDEEVVRLRQTGVKFVLASRYLEEPRTDYVTVDSMKGARLAVDYLIDLGHSRIAHLAGPESVLPFRDRKSGYLKAMKEADLPIDRDLVVPGTIGFEFGRRGLARLLELPRKRRPTAVFACTDFAAMGVLEEAQSRGIAVPEDLSVVGFDNVAFGAIVRVPLTTVDSRIDEVGRRAVQMLTDRIAGRGPETARQDVLEPRLVIRGSAARRSSGPA